MRLFPATGHVDASQTHFESNRNAFAYAERGDPAPLFQQVHRQLPDTVFLQTFITRGRDVTLLCSVTGCHSERIPGARVCSRTAAPAPSGASAARSEAALPPGPGKPTPLSRPQRAPSTPHRLCPGPLSTRTGDPARRSPPRSPPEWAGDATMRGFSGSGSKMTSHSTESCPAWRTL